LLCGLLIVFVADRNHWGDHPLDKFYWGCRVWFGFCGLGLLAALIAFARAERLWALSGFGFILNVLFLAMSSQGLGPDR
jgi:hypothetical protein